MLTLQRLLSLRQAARHPTRTALLLLSITLGVAAWIATLLLDRSLGTALKSSGMPTAGRADLEVSNGDLGVDRGLAARLVQVSGVRSVRPVLIRRVLLPDLGGRSAVLVGIDLAAEPPKEMADALGLTLRGGSAASFLAALLRGNNPVLVGDALGRELPRDGVRFPVLTAGTTRRVTRIGTIEDRGHGPAAALAGHVLLTDLRVAAALTGQADRVSRLDVLLDPAANRDGVRGELESELAASGAGKGHVVTPEAADRRATEALAGMRIAFSLCGYGALGLGLFLMASTLGVVAAERRGEIGALRALGADRGQVCRLFLGEAALLGVLGALPGIPLGWGLARLGLGPMMRALSDVYMPLEAHDLELDIMTISGALLAGLITTLLAALLPTAGAALQTPLEAMSREPADESGAGKGSGSRRMLLASVVPMGLGLGCFALGDRLEAPWRIFGTLLLILLGTVLALPALSALAARALRPIAEGVLGLPGRLAADYLIRTPGRSGFVVAALACGMALIVQTGGVIQGNVSAVRDWVDHSVMGDLFVTSGGPLSASGQIVPMPDALGPQIEADFPGVHVVPMRFHMLAWRLSGSETRVRLLALDARRYVEANRDQHVPPADLAVYERLIAPSTVLVSENFAALYGVKPGMTITLPGASGPVPLQVVGTINDFSCSRGTLVVDRARYGSQFEGGGVDVFAVFRPSTTTDGALRRRIERAPWAAEQALSILTRPELRRHILGMVDRLYAVAYIQEVVAGLVAALGVATALLISLMQRRRELGLLRALGATPDQARNIILAEAALLTLLGLAFGLLLGGALEWYVLRVILLEESGFVFPFRFPWTHAAIVAALVALSGGLAGLGPSLRAARLEIQEAIACE